METKVPQLTDQQYSFLKERLNDRATVKVGYITGVSANLQIFNQYHSLYKGVDPLYQTDLYCDACALEMGKRVWNWYGDQVEARMIAEQKEKDAQRVLLPESAPAPTTEESQPVTSEEPAEETKQEVADATTEEKPAGKKGKGGKASGN
jgi:hypothetical protein